MDFTINRTLDLPVFYYYTYVDLDLYKIGIK